MSTPKAVALAVGVSALAGVAAMGGAMYLVYGLGWPNWCRCPGATPLGTVLAVGNGSGVCPAGNGSSALDCAYTFTLGVYRADPSSPAVSARDLSFEVRDAGGGRVGTHFSVTVTTEMGCPVGIWDSSNSTWTAFAGLLGCSNPRSIDSPLETGGSFVVKSLPGGGLPYSHVGYQLFAMAVNSATGGSLSGYVAAPFL